MCIRSWQGRLCIARSIRLRNGCSDKNTAPAKSTFMMKARERISGTMNKSSANYTERFSDIQDEPSDISVPVSLVSAPPLRTMKLSALVEHCIDEMHKYRRGEVPDDTYGLEL